MGLDVTAYAKLSPASEPDADAAECRVWVMESPHFPGRAAPLTPGWYSSFGEIFGFRAGSYSVYGDWREWLARLAGYPPSHETPWDERLHTVTASEVHGGPFWELIYFSDCEGVIGSEVAAKLARDFREWDQRAQESAPDDWHYGQYARWRRAFEMAADGGAVEFA